MKQSQAAPTVDGRRTPVDALNTGSTETPQSKDMFARLRRAFRNLNLFMAGMYTGVGCGGTPHAHHRYGDESTDASKDIDRRPL